MARRRRKGSNGVFKLARRLTRAGRRNRQGGGNLTGHTKRLARQFKATLNRSLKALRRFGKGTVR